MAEQVVLGEGLLDHQQALVVEGGEGGQVLGGVGPVAGVGVDLEGDTGEGRAYGPYRLEVPARAALELDAAVAVADMPGDLVQESVDGRLDAETDTRADPLGGAADEGGEGLAAGLPVQIPAGHVEPGAGEVVAREAGGEGSRVVGVLPGAAEDHGGEVLAQDVPAALGGFAAVVGVAGRGALAPADRAVGCGRSDHDVVEVRLAVGAGLELVDQVQPYKGEFDLGDGDRHEAPSWSVPRGTNR